MSAKRFKMRLFNKRFGICRLNNDELIPDWIQNCDFYSITKTWDELSIVCLQDNIPRDVRCERDWRVLKIEGPLEFSLIGVLSSISAILAQEKISIFVVSTYDTDYILVKDHEVENAIDALTAEKYEIINA
ncbi:MAG: ACT domain-containing protein [Clostridia bacterium]|nr:ACT domain-containing protein [Clostridia bacterium]